MNRAVSATQRMGPHVSSATERRYPYHLPVGFGNAPRDALTI